MADPYEPTRADIEFRDMAKATSRNPIELARQMRLVTREYLLVVASDNMGENSALRYLIEAELRRRDLRPSLLANWISFISAVIALLSLAIAVVK